MSRQPRIPHGPLDPDSARRRERDEPLVGFIDRDGNPDADGRDLSRPVAFHPKWGFLYAPRGITS